MTRIQNILNELEGDAKNFKESCETKVCSPKLVQSLDTGLSRGRQLLRNIEEVMKHLTGIKERLEKDAEID